MAISSSSRGLRPGVCTSTTRPANPFDGMVIYETDTDKVAVYDVNAWVYKTGTTAPALVLIKTQTIGTTVSSVTVSDAFSSAYDNYFITVNGGVGSTNNGLAMTLGATTTGYYYAGTSLSYSSTAYVGLAGQNQTSWGNSFRASANSINGMAWLYDPFNAKNTHFYSFGTRSEAGSQNYTLAGYLADTTSYTAFTLTTNTGTVTGGTIQVYGYTKG